MRKVNFLFYLLMFLPVIIVIITFPIFPDKIPAHYDMAGNITRWGSKYESLVFPIITIVMGIILKASSKSGENKVNEKATISIGIAVLSLFNGMTLLFLYKDYFLAKGLEEPINVDTSQFIFILLGIFFIIMGMILPKCKMNSMVGIRTKWSMDNDKAWELSQRSAGIISIATGIIMIVGNLVIFKGGASFIFSMICLIVYVTVTIIYTKLAYKKSK